MQDTSLSLEHLDPKRILLIRLSAFGDVIHTLPLLQSLRHRFPFAQIDWAIDEAAAPLLQNLPELETVQIVPLKAFLKAPFKNALVFFQALSTLRSQSYDVVIDAQGLFKSALLTVLTRSPIKLGFACAREFAWLAYTHRVALSAKSYFSPATSIYQHYQLLMQSFGALPDFELTPLPCSLNPQRPSKQPYLLICMGSAWPSKVWSSTHWQTLCALLLTESDYSLIFVGSLAETHQVEGVLESLVAKYPHSQNRLKNACGHTDIATLHAWCEQARMVIGSDSFVIHLAAATAKPEVFGLYGSTSSIRTPPPFLKTFHALQLSPQLSCQPCHQKVCPLATNSCLEDLSPEEVWLKVQRFL
jgi:heptosyltransferase I